MNAHASPLSRMRRVVIGGAVCLLLSSLAVGPARGALADDSQVGKMKPTVVLVHGDWADASSWSGVVERLQHDGYTVRALPNPLRSLSGDAAYLAAYLHTISGPIVLVGHSYGAAVITNAATGNPQVQGLVYVDGLVPDEGQTIQPLAGPDSALAVADPTTIFKFVPATLPPTPTTDLYLKHSTFMTAFANGLPADQAEVLFASQRPSTVGALNEPSGPPAWRTIPSWYLVGTEDRVVPPSAQLGMAHRAGSTISEVKAGHLGLVSHPGAVTRVIETAAMATTKVH